MTPRSRQTLPISAIGILPYRRGNLFRAYISVGMNVEKLDLKALLFELFERMDHRVMLKSRRDYVLFALFRADRRRGEKRLIVRLASARCKVYLLRRSTDAVGDRLA